MHSETNSNVNVKESIYENFPKLNSAYIPLTFFNTAQISDKWGPYAFNISPRPILWRALCNETLTLPFDRYVAYCLQMHYQYIPFPSFCSFSQHLPTVDGMFLPWSAWSACSFTCGNGTRWRNRTCEGPFYNGAPCEGDNEEIERCFERHCPGNACWLLYTLLVFDAHSTNVD